MLSVLLGKIGMSRIGRLVCKVLGLLGSWASLAVAADVVHSSGSAGAGGGSIKSLCWNDEDKLPTQGICRPGMDWERTILESIERRAS